MYFLNIKTLRTYFRYEKKKFSLNLKYDILAQQHLKV